MSNNELITIDDDEHLPTNPVEDLLANGTVKRPSETPSLQSDEPKRQKSIPNIANELARNRAESRLPALGAVPQNASGTGRPRIHAIPLSSLLSPSIDHNYLNSSPSPAIPAPFSAVIPKLETPSTVTDNRLPLKQESTAASTPLTKVPSASPSMPVTKSTGGAKAAAGATKKATTRKKSETAAKKKAEGTTAASRKKSDGTKAGPAKKTATKNSRKEKPAAANPASSPSATPQPNNARTVILPSQDGSLTPTGSNMQSQEGAEELPVLVATTGTPVNATTQQKGLKRSQSNLNPSQKSGTQDASKAKKTLSATNLSTNAASPSPSQSLSGPSASEKGTGVASTSKKTANSGAAKKENKSKSKQVASKKKETSAIPVVPASETTSPPVTAPQTPKKLSAAPPIKSPSLMDVFDQKSSGSTVEENDVPIIVLDVPLYQVDNEDYLDENGQVVFNFYNLVEEKYGSQAVSRSKDGASAGSKGENADDLEVMEDDDEEEDEKAGSASGAPVSKNPKKKPNPLKGKSRVGKYDIEDPFIDDSELLWEEQRAATKDGFFVYFGPLIQKGQYATFERVDGTMKKGGVRNPR
ncbi:HCL329Cp [Eremothecium sinecaudum]|uniref:HCL329Cp n=1 Tax=Eremothecium sinecaudum TaxID=45286 RepID=A0A109UZ51_9SACH|nr:HCL329Cp [Eremothecium sinecaudum]AMD19822.1 HCL329Cp [Eremothecium sinecaudum]